MTDENSKKLKRWGFGVAAVNVAYSIIFMGVAISDILCHTNNVLDWILFGMYMINIFVNTPLIKPFLNCNPVAIAIWFNYTMLVLLFRIILRGYNKWSNGLELLSLFVNVYILVSLVIMIIVCLNLVNFSKNIMKGLDWKKVKTDLNVVSPQESFGTGNVGISSNIYKINHSEVSGYDNMTTLNCNIEYLPSAPDFEFVALDDVQLNNAHKTFCHDDTEIESEENCRADKTELDDKKRDECGGATNDSKQ